MKLIEVFERAGIVTDEKARRVVNTSGAVARITAEEIEHGVTLERLASIGVPVFRYATQITIHGGLPDFSDTVRPVGYRSVFRNGNGTVGVRYVAIDAEKKSTMIEAARFGTKGWATHLNSEGLTVGRQFAEKTECLAAFRDFPKDLICGGVTAGAGAFGEFYVVAYVGAVPAENLWPLIARLWQVENGEQLAALSSARDAAQAADAATRQQAQAARQAELNAKRDTLAATVNLPRLASLPQGPCEFVRVGTNLTDAVLRLYTVKRRGPGLFYTAQNFPNPDAPGKAFRYDAARQGAFNADCRKGWVFAAQ